MEMGDDNNMSAVAMPGFIDILSTVIIMFVFFVTVIAIMLYVHTVKYKAQVLANSQEQVSEEVMAYIEKIKSGEIKPDDLQAIVDLAEKKSELQKEFDTLAEDVKQIKPEYAQNNEEQETKEVIEDKVFLIFFDKNAITTADSVEQKIADFLGKLASQPQWKNMHFSITGGTNMAAPTVAMARELSLARMLNTRNNLIKLEIPKDRISVFYSQETIPGAGSNWVKIMVTP